ncbi:MAG: hypothetical protein ACYC6M_10795 [Terriglobales bacterium]
MHLIHNRGIESRQPGGKALGVGNVVGIAFQAGSPVAARPRFCFLRMRA